jgi:hypothetical protein
LDGSLGGLFEALINIMWSLIVFSISYISFRGYKILHSPTILRLSLAFFFLGWSFALVGITIFNEMGFFPSLNIIIPILIIFAALLETIGYFFLAFSHIINVLSTQKFGFYILVIPLSFSLLVIFQSLSFFFLTYGAIETGISWSKSRKISTLIITIGLSMITVGEFISWMAYLYPNYIIFSYIPLLIKILGFLTLFTPTVNYIRYKGGKLQWSPIGPR